MGFTSSYHEIMLFEKNAAMCRLDELFKSSGEEAATDGTLLMAADNVDHNTRTLDGLGSYHGMGMIGAFTPRRDIMRKIPRRKLTSAIRVTICNASGG